MCHTYTDVMYAFDRMKASRAYTVPITLLRPLKKLLVKVLALRDVP